MLGICLLDQAELQQRHKIIIVEVVTPLDADRLTQQRRFLGPLCKQFQYPLGNRGIAALKSNKKLPRFFNLRV